MAITLESLYQPINDFFIRKFNTGNENPISFKFDQFGTKIGLEDFALPRNPEEVFSDFVNRMPQVGADGVNVLFSTKKIDQSYFYELLSPALPAFANGSDASDEESITQNFSKLQHKAVSDYEMLWQARAGVGDKFWVSYPTPLLWYDPQNTSIWEDYDFQAIERKELNPSSRGLWKLKLSETLLQNAVPELTQAVKIENNSNQVDFKPLIFKFQHKPNLAKPITRAIDLTDRRPDVLTMKHELKATSAVQLNFHQSFAKLTLMDKVAVVDLIKNQAPSKDVSATQISVHFQYAIVQIRRPWLFDIFLDNENWRIPGVQQGAISRTGNFNHLPIAFIVVRDLRISANWSAADRENSREATNFGPFQLGGEIDEKGSVGYQGIQVIGWLLQQMPSFPPK